MPDDPPPPPTPGPSGRAPQAPQAPPLPLKLGEIGYVPPPPGTPAPAAAGVSTVDVPIPSSPRPAAAATTTTTSSATTGPAAENKQRARTWHGFQLSTLLYTLVVVLFIGGTIAGWVLAAIHLQSNTSLNVSTPAPSPSQSAAPNNSSSTGPASAASTSQSMLTSGLIFIHVAFAVTTLLELVLLDRLLLRLLRQRRAFLRPPTTSDSPNPEDDDTQGGSLIARLAPWSRPALPTYGAAVLGNTRGTGDVEDIEIARPPPPEYGNTRGSTLLLANMLRRASGGSRLSRSGSGRSGRGGDVEMAQVQAEEGQGEEATLRADAARARALEEALGRLTMPLAAVPGRR